jgi:hypothetical protein
LTPVNKIDGRLIGTEPGFGLLTRRLLTLYHEETKAAVQEQKLG